MFRISLERKLGALLALDAAGYGTRGSSLRFVVLPHGDAGEHHIYLSLQALLRGSQATRWRVLRAD
jgi:hypothetical protein